MRIAVLYNKPSARFLSDPTHKAAEEDTEVSANEVMAALKSKGADVILTPITEHTIDQIINGINADLTFNLIEWTGVDEGFAMHAFDVMNARNLRYTGASKDSYHNSCDKLITKNQCRDHNLPTADWQAFRTGEEPITVIHYPVLVKVSNEHSSVGIGVDSIAHDEASLRTIVRKRITEYKQPAFAETFLGGREFQITLLERSDGLAVLPPAEIVYSRDTDVPLLTYKSRWDASHHDYENSTVRCVPLEKALAQRLHDMCVRAFPALGFRDYARFDIRCDTEGHPYFLELNSNPGLGDDDEYGMTLSYKAVGMTFADFIWEIVESATRRAKG